MPDFVPDLPAFGRPEVDIALIFGVVLLAAAFAVLVVLFLLCWPPRATAPASTAPDRPGAGSRAAPPEPARPWTQAGPVPDAHEVWVVAHRPGVLAHQPRPDGYTQCCWAIRRSDGAEFGVRLLAGNAIGEIEQLGWCPKCFPPLPAAPAGVGPLGGVA